ncbi:MAG: transcriptional regulator [Proteobacteria bacterium]|nr:MAG: transcriptional regulator [Pseudomonadota bacterium]
MDMPQTAVPTSVRLTEENAKNIEQFSKLTRRSRSFLINEALEAYIKDRMAYVQELQEAVASIEAEPSYAAEDVFTWMQSWGTESELPSPRLTAKK